MATAKQRKAGRKAGKAMKGRHFKVGVRKSTRKSHKR